MRVSEHTSALVIRPVNGCGRVVLVLHETRVDPELGMMWRCRTKGQELDLPELALFALDLRGASDPDARELLDDAGQRAWDAWFASPDIDF